MSKRRIQIPVKISRLRKLLRIPRVPREGRRRKLGEFQRHCQCSRGSAFAKARYSFGGLDCMTVGEEIAFSLLKAKRRHSRKSL
jgi:hypothetical protein